ncbi:MAG TPA: septum formation initiator family protein [Ktedonobacteraceae bacterium]
MQSRPRRPNISSRPEGSNVNVTSAVGMEETVGHQRAKRNSLFTQTVIWISGLVCSTFLLGTFAQACSNSQLVQQVQTAQQSLQQARAKHTQLEQAATYYKDPSVIESEARQQLGYVRPGEQAVMIIGTNNGGQPQTPKQKSKPQQQGNWQDWWHIFFNG